MKTVGVDLSMTGTGVAAIIRGVVIGTEVIGSDDHAPALDRMNAIIGPLMSWCVGADLVVVEGPQYGKLSPGSHERAGLHWRFLDAATSRGLAYALCPPSTLKKYATGKGNASKDAVLIAAARRFPDVDIAGNDAADALWLAHAGADHFGEPVVGMPAANVAALAGVAWPVSELEAGEAA